MSDKQSPKEIADAFESYSVVINSVARYAADIAHARKVMFDAYVAEGFTPDQAIKLCQVLP